ncbi:phospholipid scramblase 2-like [Planococcus citri]|uniref:phospholipid scramblase 2-like n=1 Tax=Planococcus citri TaxID=170843 RepID=UPI0031F99C37
MSSMNIFDNDEQEVIHLSRQDTCETTSCFPCCCGRFVKLEVTSPAGELFGAVEQIIGWATFGFDIKNETGCIVLKIKKKSETKFKILSSDKSTELGEISTTWNNTKLDISFPPDLDVRIKAVLLGASLLIDCAVFKNTSSSDD